MGAIFRACYATARKKHICARCGGEIDVGERHAVIVRHFYLQLRTDRAHVPLCRPLDPDGVLVNGHIGRVVTSLIADVAKAYVTGESKIPRWLRRNYEECGEGGDYWREDDDLIDIYNELLQRSDIEDPSPEMQHVWSHPDDDK